MQLPVEIGIFLSDVDTVERFEWNEFTDRIEEKGDYSPGDNQADAVHHAQVAMAVMDDAQ